MGYYKEEKKIRRLWKNSMKNRSLKERNKKYCQIQKWNFSVWIKKIEEQGTATKTKI